VIGASRKAVSSARTRIEIMLHSAERKLDYTHFISLPLNVPPILMVSACSCTTANVTYMSCNTWRICSRCSGGGGESVEGCVRACVCVRACACVRVRV
jgi:hypothetical protein